MENYLETIYILQQKTGYVRAIDIATELGFSKPSVSNAMKKLRAEGYITVTDRSKIALTEAGRKVAEATYERHCVIAASLMRIGVSEKTALEDACRMEHVISQESFKHLRDAYNAHKEE